MQNPKIRTTKMVVRGVAIIFIASLLLILSTDANAAQDIKSKIDEYIGARQKMGHFSGSILVAKEGRILVKKGYGMANYDLDVSNTPKTKFRLGSITKQFTAMAIMQLQEKGLLDVDDPIKKYIPKKIWRPLYYPENKEVTIHHLLTHTSGMPNIANYLDYTETFIPFSVEELVKRLKDKPLVFTPGEEYGYGNTGYIVLAYIIEQVSGKTYEEFLNENIFVPLNMMNTGNDQNLAIIENRAAGYFLVDDQLYNVPYFDMSLAIGSGSLYSTIEDLCLWDRALYTEKLVSKSSLDKIFTPFMEYYGHGWFIGELFEHKRIGHRGGINGFSTGISRYVDDDVCIIVLSNIENVPMADIERDLAAIVFGEDYELPKERETVEVDPKILDMYVGEYEADPDYILVVTKEDNQLFIDATEESNIEIYPGLKIYPKFKLYPESDTTFFLKGVTVEITFRKNKKDEVTELIGHMDGEDFPAPKIK